MLTKRVIPCLDIKDGRVVKGVRFAGLQDSGDPRELAARYEAEGADELVMLDVSATPSGRSSALDTVRLVRSVLSIPLCVGGGVRSVEDARALLDSGADKVGVNTAAFDRPELLTELNEQFGSQCIVLAIDAAQRIGESGWEVVTRSGTNRTGVDAVRWAREGTDAGAGEILLTSWDRDGTRTGYDLELVSSIRGATQVPIIASGGASTTDHMIEAFRAGADAVLAASIFHEQETTPSAIKVTLGESGIEVRA